MKKKLIKKRKINEQSTNYFKLITKLMNDLNNNEAYPNLFGIKGFVVVVLLLLLLYLNNNEMQKEISTKSRNNLLIYEVMNSTNNDKLKQSVQIKKQKSNLT
jgi:energy-converting hydrogenase Eha subunit H